MDRQVFDDDLTDLEDINAYVPHVRNMPRGKKNGKPRPPHNWMDTARTYSDVIQQEDERFNITYHAARHEAQWLRESLESFYLQKWFDDVLRMVKGGKEASVYLCLGNATTGLDYLAAKVYRPRRFRNLKNDWIYREGRANLDENGNEITNHGMMHAMQKRTEYGRQLLHTSWLEHEFSTLQMLHQAGADVPRPLASETNAILMEYYGDGVMGAPTLNDVDLEAHETRELYERVLHNIELMLSHGRIHADLSAFNILYWEGEIVLIDFPQSIHPEQNRSAFRIFERDVVRVCEYFQSQGVRSSPRKLAADLWQKYNLSFVPQLDPKTLSEDNDTERDLWEGLKNA